MAYPKPTLKSDTHSLHKYSMNAKVGNVHALPNLPYTGSLVQT